VSRQLRRVIPPHDLQRCQAAHGAGGAVVTAARPRDAVLTALTVLAVYSLLMYGLMTEAMVSQV